MRILIFTACIFLLAACKDDDSIPKGIIAKDNMGKILWDMIEADQYSIQYLTKDSARKTLKAETMKLYEEIFRIHHISKEEFQKSFQFYTSHPDITKTMFDSLSARANRQRIDLYKRPNKLKPD
jgi:hypothetical protein